jgi:hypothetical protein
MVLKCCGVTLKTHMNRQNTPKVPGPDSAGQSGADQGLPEEAEADSESAKELVQEGQFLEANVVDAIECARARMLPRSALGSFLKMTYRRSTSSRTDYARSDASDPGSDHALGRRSPASSTYDESSCPFPHRKQQNRL